MNYTLSDDSVVIDDNVDIEEFAKINDLDPGEIQKITELQVGGSVSYGGGASPIFRLTRVA